MDFWWKILILLAFVYLIRYTFLIIIEPVYIMVFNRPVYVHFYIFPKKLLPYQKQLIEKEFSFYRNLSDKRKRYFEHRIARFVDKYSFVAMENSVITEEMRLYTAATSTMLTFGMRDYLYSVFNKIIIYPDIYFSVQSDTYHKGEFNPAEKAIAFSWPHFLDGLKSDRDNINLGLHEFAHALHFYLLQKKNNSSSSAIYKSMFRKIIDYISKNENRKKLLESNYLREYAFTNQHEFTAVILEHFFETPEEFKQKLPKLYIIIKKMINYN